MRVAEGWKDVGERGQPGVGYYQLGGPHALALSSGCELGVVCPPRGKTSTALGHYHFDAPFLARKKPQRGPRF